MIANFSFIPICICLLILTQCGKRENPHFEIAIRGSNDDVPGHRPAIRITEREIVCIDWVSQSYLLNDSIASVIKQYPYIGISPDYITFSFEDSIYSTVGIWRRFSSNILDPDKFASVIFNETDFELLHDNWLVINPTRALNQKGKNNEPEFFNDLYNEKVFVYFYSQGMLNGANWYCGNENVKELPLYPGINDYPLYEVRWKEKLWKKIEKK